MSRGQAATAAISDCADLFKQAQTRWWNEDFSWDGLARKPLRPDGTKTLQDYWKQAFPNEALIEFAGRRWLRFHLPMDDLDGIRSSKSSWSQSDMQHFDKCMHDLIEGNPPPGLVGLVANEGIARSQLSGVVFPAPLRIHAQRVGRIVARHAVFLEEVELAPGSADMIDFTWASFLGLARFQNLVLTEGVTFRNAMFARDALFDRVSFNGHTVFECQFLDDTEFADCTFAQSGSLFEIQHTRFEGFAEFSRTTFAANTEFSHVTFAAGANFGRSEFSRDVSFANCTFSLSCSFEAVKFSARLEVRDTVFDGDVSFVDTEFMGQTSVGNALEGATSRIRFCASTDFSSPQGRAFHRGVAIFAEFKDKADFRGRVFQHDVSFAGSIFSDLPLFHGARLPADVSFGACKFALPDWVPLLPEVPQVEKRTSSLYVVRWWRERRRLRQRLDVAGERFESAYRVLREHSVGGGNPEQEALFYALELDARRRRASIPSVERWLAWLFKLTSSYGRNPAPLVALWISAVALWLVVMPFIVLKSVDPRHWPSYQRVASFALAQFVPLPTVWRPESVEDEKVKWLGDLYSNSGLMVGIMGTLAAIVTISAVALLLIILRRRFALK